MPPLETEEEAEKRIKNRQEEAFNKNVEIIKLARQKSKSNGVLETIKFDRKKLKRQKSKSESESEKNIRDYFKDFFNQMKEKEE